jgi:hypothetical protein
MLFTSFAFPFLLVLLLQVQPQARFGGGQSQLPHLLLFSQFLLGFEQRLYLRQVVLREQLLLLLRVSLALVPTPYQ